MQYPISEKIRSLKPSAIREIFKYASDPAVISLAAGTPAAETLPVDIFSGFLAKIMEEEPESALLYSQSEGHPPLREAIRHYLSSRHGIVKEFDELIITSGAQQCMDLATKVLCNEGDTVICEDPSFIGSLNTFRSYGVNLAGVPMDGDGVNIEKLEIALQNSKNVRFLYLIPNFQNPTGITMSFEKRKACYDLAKKYNVLILEDNPYGDLRFAGESLPSIKSMDEDGIVMYAGTMSKILASGIRVGYLIAPAALMGKIVVGKQCVDVHTSMLAQLLCCRFFTECDVDEHIRGIVKTYDRKCNLMLSEMDGHFPKSVSYTRPQGGLFVWATLPNGDDSAPFVTALVRDYKVAVVPGTAFCAEDGAKSSSFRLNFSTPSDENIVGGVRRVAEALKAAGY